MKTPGCSYANVAIGRATSAPELGRPSASPVASSLDSAPFAVEGDNRLVVEQLPTASKRPPSPAAMLAGKLKTSTLGTATIAEQEERAKAISKLKAPSFGGGGKSKYSSTKKLGARKLKLGSGAGIKLSATLPVNDDARLSHEEDAVEQKSAATEAYLRQAMPVSSRLAEAYQATTEESPMKEDVFAIAAPPATSSTRSLANARSSNSTVSSGMDVPAMDKYKNAKSISSGQLFGSDAASEAHAIGNDRDRLSAPASGGMGRFAGKTAISSEMFFNHDG